ncbi:cytochrome c oxidase cbb3-type subunit 3 [Povalibacter uvarum]|uniref:Cbb3-type cytochrome c oxidase subunit n=1 Tax=Povalibacter uvarum TaxID=732238 RepID=A0A841HJC8_9GAMM|nr:cytochrome-c oxidase, cbb3-type subunit III [Povalibacter uvarum]MBB6092135.1 cytochrome c oxidase cbb3-type subunit 3 [Povalibacter uvarum]
MMSERVSLFIIAFTVINVLACVWLLWWTAKSRGPQAPEGSAEPARVGHVWDGDLEEYNNPLPRWWLWLFVITVIFGAAYLYVFPGLGNFAGSKQWSSVGAYEAQAREREARLEQQFAGIHSVSLAELSKDPAAMSTARNLFGANCSTCHGSDARGAQGFPNLADNDWLWGGAESTIYESIANGRRSAMPALGTVLGREGLNEVASYVVSLSGVQAPADWIAAGKERFATLCAACHGADAKGNAVLGAPNLTDSIWLFGGDFATVRTTIENGRNSTMPAHASLLGDTRVKLLAAYVYSLSAQERVADETTVHGGTGGDASP